MFLFFSYEEESSGSLETPRLAISIMVSLLKGSCLGTVFGKNFSVEEFDSVGTWAVSSISGTPVP